MKHRKPLHSVIIKSCTVNLHRQRKMVLSTGVIQWYMLNIYATAAHSEQEAARRRVQEGDVIPPT